MPYQDVMPDAFEALIQTDENGVILDVRTPAEYSSGYIPGAINIDFYNPAFTVNVTELDPSKNYYVYCRSGGRSASAGHFMHQNGFENVTNLVGGMNNWTGKVEQ